MTSIPSKLLKTLKNNSAEIYQKLFTLAHSFAYLYENKNNNDLTICGFKRSIVKMCHWLIRKAIYANYLNAFNV